MFLDPAVRVLVYPVAWWLFVSGLDDLFIDLVFAYQSLTGRDSWDLSLEQLDETPEKRLAIFIPLWREYEVIEDMINHNIAAIDYHDYDIFLGVYPNDPRTLEKAVLLEERYPRVHKSICPHDGPTNKADCLNWIYLRMKLEEEARAVRYEAIVQHDAEDIVHPKALKLINRLIGEYDMVQIPVFPLETPLKNFTHGTYCDEFAEYQVKDIYTRQCLGGFVPAAGVGTAFRREALDEIAALYRNQIYNVNTLTEDYDIGLKFKRHDKRQILVRKALPLVGRNGNGNGRRANNHGNRNANGRNGRRNGKSNGNSHSANRRNGNGAKFEFIATREYFPHSFRHAVRQKSRWVMGISLQGWEQQGWRGPLRHAYWYWRDRKGLVGNVVTLLSNFLFLYCLLLWLVSQAFHTGWRLANAFPPGGFAWWLVAINTAFIFERLFYKMYAVRKIYGGRQAWGAVFRTPWANLINFAATVEALRTYFRAKALRAEVKWEKTSHAFPTLEQLMEYKRRLGELLLENRLVNALQLEQALETQGETGERLGEALIRLGYLTENDFTRMLGQQQNIEVQELDPYALDLAALRRLPREVAEEWQIIPMAFLNGDALLVASPEVVSAEAVAAVEQATGLRVTAVLTPQSDFHFALERAYGRLQFDPSGKVRLGEALVAAGHITPEQLQEALREQKRTHRPLGEVLLLRGWVDEALLSGVFEKGTGRAFRRVRKEDVRPEVAAVLPLELQRELQAVPVERQGQALTVAVGWPLEETNVRRLEAASGCAVEIVYAPPADLAAILGLPAGEKAASSGA